MLRRRTAHRTRFYSLRWVTPLVLVVPFGLVAGCVVFMVAVASKPDGSAGVAIAGVLTLPALGMAGWGASLTLRPVTLTRSALRIPNGFKTVVISLDDVAGVGLLCHDFRPNTRSARTWSVFV